MRCQSCGANVNGAFCEYCGAKMPVERVETQTINAEHVVVNNYYQSSPGEPAGYARSQQFSGNFDVDGASPKSKLITLILWFFLGLFGGHRFYIGSYGLAVVYLFTLGLFGIGWLADLALLLLGRLKDRDGLPVVNW